MFKKLTTFAVVTYEHENGFLEPWWHPWFQNRMIESLCIISMTSVIGANSGCIVYILLLVKTVFFVKLTVPWVKSVPIFKWLRKCTKIINRHPSLRIQGMSCWVPLLMITVLTGIVRCCFPNLCHACSVCRRQDLFCWVRSSKHKLCTCILL
jgi:hypothetical protein